MGNYNAILWQFHFDMITLTISKNRIIIFICVQIGDTISSLLKVNKDFFLLHTHFDGGVIDSSGTSGCSQLTSKIVWHKTE